MLSCCNDLITTIFLEEDFSSHEDFDELNPSKLSRTLAIEDSEFKIMRQLEDLNLKPSILKQQFLKEF